jgi:hypothetical protein
MSEDKEMRIESGSVLPEESELWQPERLNFYCCYNAHTIHPNTVI